VVIAPAWCECHPPEVARAALGGVPIVATSQARGPWQVAAEVAAGDAAALEAAISSAARPIAAQAWQTLIVP
jgi:hypothetical protein